MRVETDGSEMCYAISLLSSVLIVEWAADNILRPGVRDFL